MNPDGQAPTSKRGYNFFLQMVAGLGGLLYGVDVGIIGGALPYLQATSHLTNAQLSIIVAAVLLGSVISTFFAGMIADWMGRKPFMVLSGVAFVISIPVIALSQGYTYLFLGRLLQGTSAGFIGVVVPLYLAECLPASGRGKGTGIFQWMLTLGIFAAALVGMYYSYRVADVTKLGDAQALFDFQNRAWRQIFWVSLPPGLLFVLGAMMVGESPRWLFRRGQREKARAALLRSRTGEQAALELHEMEEPVQLARVRKGMGEVVNESLFQRKYIIPFLLACVILFCNTATGINSVIGFNTAILLQSGLGDLQAHWGYVIFTGFNFLMTMIGVMLVDRKGRKFLLVLGTGGIIVSLVTVGVMFLGSERASIDFHGQMQQEVAPDQSLTVHFTPEEAQKLLAASGYTGNEIEAGRASFAVIYSYGGFTATTSYVRSDDPGAAPLHITRDSAVPNNAVEALFQNPFANLKAAQTAPLHIEKAIMGPVPAERHGWLIALGLYAFVSFYAMGPGVCVWLALSELMPTRIRSNGMSIALVINQLVSTTLAAIFLPFVSKYGYSSIFFLFAGFTVVYFLAATFLLPETKGKTLEEIEAHFEGKSAQVEA